MPLPTFHCPACRNPLTVETVFANEAVREAILQLIEAHPEAAKLLRPLMSYIGLFAPEKTAMRYERIAALLGEVVPMIRSGEVCRNRRTWPAPLAYWRQGLEEVVARGHSGALRRPLGTHGYLLEIVAGLASKDDAKREAVVEQQRAGVSGVGTAPERAAQAVTTSALRPPMPTDVRAQLLAAAGSKKLVASPNPSHPKESS